MLTIGYYVHHHGRGHLARALAIASHQPARFRLLGTGLAGLTGEIPYLELSTDLPDATTCFDAYAACPGNLHYAPLGNSGIRSRMATLAGWIAQAKPDLIVCDVSVEVGMLARLTATPTAYVRLNGERTDPAHLEAFRSAKILLAPFHPALDDPETPAWVRRKTAYFPGITTIKSNRPLAANIILVVNGAGGEMLCGEAIAAAARAVPRYRWRTIGAASTPASAPENLTMLGWTSDAEAEISNAAIIIGGAGDGLVSAVIATGKPFLCLPQTRPFNEQVLKAKRLQALGAAILLETWPQATEWPGFIDLALALDPTRLAALHDPEGAKKAFEFLTSGFSADLLKCQD
jgi:hypothetical protein